MNKIFNLNFSFNNGVNIFLSISQYSSHAFSSCISLKFCFGNSFKCSGGVLKCSSFDFFNIILLAVIQKCKIRHILNHYFAFLTDAIEI